MFEHTIKSGYWKYDINEKNLELSKGARLLLSVDEKALTLCSIENHVLGEDLVNYKTFVEEALSNKYSQTNLRFFINQSTKSCMIKTVSSDSKDFIHGYIEDHTEHWEKEQLNGFKLDLSDKIERNSSTGSFQWNLNERHFYCSDNFFAVTQLMGYNEDNKLDTKDFISAIEPERRNYVLEVMHECVTLNQEFEVTFKLAIGEQRIVRMHGFPEGDVQHKLLTGFIVDVSNEVHLDHDILKGQDSERKRISMELHDSVGQKCIAVKYMLTLMQIENNYENVDSLKKSIDEIINEIRSITHNLSTEIVPEVGLQNAINQVLSECAKAIGATSEFQFEIPEGFEIPMDASKMIYRIIQEALSNTMKYSKASRVSVIIKHQNRQLILRISDNGSGFDPLKETYGIGIQNIKKRVSSLSGFININSVEGSGTEIKIKIPTN